MQIIHESESHSHQTPQEPRREKSLSWQASVLAMVAFMCVAVDGLPAGAAVIVAPNAFAGVEAALNHSQVLRLSARTVQTVFDDSQLTSIGVGGMITGMTWRLDGGQPTWPAANRTFTNYDVQLSTSLNPAGSLSTTFANNIGGDVVLVRSGSLTIPLNSFPGGAGPNAFGHVISFTTPYTYTGSDLLITIRHTGSGVDQREMDANINIVGMFETQFADGYTATTGGTARTPIFQLQFQPAAVPEPASLTLVSLGTVGVAFAAWRQRRRRGSASSRLE